jgi:hypothetical protein
VDEQKTARTHSRADCPHVDQVDLTVETRKPSVDIAEFKPAIVGYNVLVQDHGGEVYAHDLDMRELAGHGYSPEENYIKRPPQAEV